MHDVQLENSVIVNNKSNAYSNHLFFLTSDHELETSKLIFVSLYFCELMNNSKQSFRHRVSFALFLYN